MLVATMLRLPVLALVALFAALLQAQSFDLDRGRQAVVSLDGNWRFHPGDSPGSAGAPFLWAQPGFDDSAWPLLRSDASWSDQGYPGLSGFGWYRFALDLPAGDRPASLMLAPILTSYEVYVDGRYAGGSGNMPPALIPASEISFHLYPLTAAGSRSPRRVQVALRVWHAPIWAVYVGGGPIYGGHLAGDPALLSVEQGHRQVARNTLFVDAYAYSITSALVGLAILGLFLIRPAEREYLWFAVMLLAQSADNALYVGQQIFSWLPVPIYDLLDGILVAANVIAAFCFFARVLNAHARRLGRVLLALAALSPLGAIAYWPGWFSPAAAGMVWFALLFPAVLWIVGKLLQRSIQGDTNARLLLAPTVLDLGFYFADNLAIVLNQAGWTTVPHILEVRLPLPPFTVQTGTLFHLVFLLALLIFLIRRFSLARSSEQRMAGEFEAARQVQQVLLPDELDQCPGFRVECVYQPADQVGGDFFQQMADGRGGMSIVVGDVSGKGLP
ncbi:MAG: hypothetical protein WCE75_00420, partial [Terracidiphilus sp.]